METETNTKENKNVIIDTGHPTSWEDIFCLGQDDKGNPVAEGLALNCFVYLIDTEQDKVYGGWVYTFSDECHDICLKNVIVHQNSNRKNFLYNVDYYYVNFDKNVRMEIKKPKKGIKEKEDNK